MTTQQRYLLIVFIAFSSSLLFGQQETLNDSLIGETLSKGAAFLGEKKYDSANYFLHKALKAYKKTDNKVGVSKAYINLSSLNTYLHEQDSANYYLLETQEISKSINNKVIQANIYLNIAHLNFQNQDFVNALNYAHKSESIQLKIGDSKAIAGVFNNLAVLYRRVNDFKRALDYNLKSLDINIKEKDSLGIAKSYNNIGLLKETLGDPSGAISYYKLAIDINEKARISNPNPYKNLGAIYLNTGKYKLSNASYSKALELEKTINVTSKLKGIYNVMLHNYIQLKDFEKAIEFQEKHDQLEIADVKNQNQKKIEALKNQLELYQKEKELEYEKSVNEKNNIIFFVVLGLLVLTLLFFLQSNRTNLLKRKQDRLLLESKVLRAQMNPHFIFNALTAIQNSLMDSNPLQSATYLSRFSKLIRQNFEFVNKEHITLSEDIDALKNYIETQLMRFDNSFEYTIEVDSTIDVFKVEIPPLLIQPFVENSIEHGFKNKTEKGNLKIEIVKEKQFVLIRVIDNGNGFDTQIKATEEHSFSVAKKRLRLLSKTAEKSFRINSSSKGTEVQFKININ